MNDVFEEWDRSEHEVNWEEWEKASQQGTVRGGIFKGTDEKIYIYVGF